MLRSSSLIDFLKEQCLFELSEQKDQYANYYAFETKSDAESFRNYIASAEYPNLSIDQCQNFLNKFPIEEKEIYGEKCFVILISLELRSLLLKHRTNILAEIIKELPKDGHSIGLSIKKYTECENRLNLARLIYYTIKSFDDQKQNGIYKNKLTFPWRPPIVYGTYFTPDPYISDEKDYLYDEIDSKESSEEDADEEEYIFDISDSDYSDDGINHEHDATEMEKVVDADKMSTYSFLEEGSILLSNMATKDGWYAQAGINSLDFMYLLYLALHIEYFSSEEIEKFLAVKEMLVGTKQRPYLTGLKADANLLDHLYFYHTKHLRPANVDVASDNKKGKPRRDRLIAEDIAIQLWGGWRNVVNYEQGQSRISSIKADKPSSKKESVIYQSGFMPGSENETDIITLSGAGREGHIISIIISKEKDEKQRGGYAYYYTRCNGGIGLKKDKAGRPITIYTTRILPRLYNGNVLTEEQQSSLTSAEVIQAIAETLTALITAERNLKFYAADSKEPAIKAEWEFWNKVIEENAGRFVVDKSSTTEIQKSGNCPIFSMCLASTALLQIKFGNRLGLNLGYDMLQVFKSFHLVRRHNAQAHFLDGLKTLIDTLQEKLDEIAQEQALSIMFHCVKDYFSADDKENLLKALTITRDKETSILTYRLECKNKEVAVKVAQIFSLSPYNQDLIRFSGENTLWFRTQFHLFHRLFSRPLNLFPDKDQDTGAVSKLRPKHIQFHCIDDQALYFYCYFRDSHDYQNCLTKLETNSIQALELNTDENLIIFDFATLCLFSFKENMVRLRSYQLHETLEGVRFTEIMSFLYQKDKQDPVILLFGLLGKTLSDAIRILNWQTDLHKGFCPAYALNFCSNILSDFFTQFERYYYYKIQTEEQRSKTFQDLTNPYDSTKIRLSETLGCFWSNGKRNNVSDTFFCKQSVFLNKVEELNDTMEPIAPLELKRF